MSERELKSAHLRKLALNWSSFRSGQLEDWLDRLDHVDSSELKAVVEMFIEDDPRESETVRQRLPQLADLMKHLPKAKGEYGGQFPCCTFDPSRGEIEFHGGMTADTLGEKNRVEIGMAFTKELTQKWRVVDGKRVVQICFEWDSAEAQKQLDVLRMIDPSGYNRLLKLKEANSQPQLEVNA